jgi:hypothetical protein
MGFDLEHDQFLSEMVDDRHCYLIATHVATETSPFGNPDASPISIAS